MTRFQTRISRAACVFSMLSCLILPSPLLRASGFAETELSARSAALSGACLTLDGDIAAFEANPATGASVRTFKFSTGYVNHFGRIGAGSFMFSQPLALGVFHGGLKFLSTPRIDEINAGVYSGRMVSFSSLIISSGWAVKLSDRISMGLEAEYSGGYFTTGSVSSLFAGAGFLGTLPLAFLDSDLKAGVSIRNAGGPLTSRGSPPVSFRAGLGWHKTDFFELASDLEFPLVRGSSPALRVGAESTVFKNLHLRAGFLLEKRMLFPSFGAGFSFIAAGSKWELSAGWSPHQDLGNSVVISFSGSRLDPSADSIFPSKFGKINYIVSSKSGGSASIGDFTRQAVANLTLRLAASPDFTGAEKDLDLLIETSVELSGRGYLLTVRCLDIGERELCIIEYGFSDPSFLDPLYRRIAGSIEKLIPDYFFRRCSFVAGPGDRIFIDGIEAGTSPLRPLRLKTGKHAIRVESRDGLVSEIPIEVSPASDNRFDLKETKPE